MTLISSQEPKTAHKDLNKLWEDMEKNARNFLQKIEILKKFRHLDMAVTKYPSGVPVVTVNQVSKCIKESKQSFDDLIRSTLSVGHHKEFHLVRNETALHTAYENLQSKTGRQNSTSIQDIGEFRIAKVEDISRTTYIVDEADFTLYCVDEKISL